MITTRPTLETERNLLLRSVLPANYDKLAESIVTQDVALHDLIFEAGERVQWITFPQTGMISMVIPLENGAPVEAATVGTDGVVGLPVYFGSGTSNMRAITQMAGTLHKIRPETFLDLIEKDSGFRKRLHQFAEVAMESIAQTSACNRFHSIEQRCARWLLITGDRAESDTFLLTQEFLAQMLGVRRPGVTVAAGVLKQAGLIAYSRGKVRILNREGLEKASCECYRRMKNREDAITQS